MERLSDLIRVPIDELDAQPEGGPPEVPNSVSVPYVASFLNCDPKTLRGALDIGAVRGRRVRGRWSLERDEALWLLVRWEDLRALRAALQRERSVHFAVIYGDFARMDGHLDTAIDLLVASSDPQEADLWFVAQRLERFVGRQVQVGSLARALSHQVLLEAVLEDGRLLRDRRGIWPELLSRQPAIEHEAELEFQRQRRRARSLLGDLLEELEQ